MGVTCCLRPQRPEQPSCRTRTPCTFLHPRTTMSWQSYVDDQLISTNMIKNAVIAGHDGNIWASSSGFNVTAAELKVILDRYSSTDQLAMNGVTVGGTKYMFPLRQRQGRPGRERTVWCSLHQDCSSPDCVRVRGAGGAGAGRHRDGEAGRVPHLRWLLAHQLVLGTTGVWQSTSGTQSINIFYVFQLS